MPAQSMREQLEDAFDGKTEEKTEAGTEEAGGSGEDTSQSLGDTGEEDASTEKNDKEDSGDKGELPAGDTVDESGSDEATDDKVGETEKQDTGESAVKAPASWKPDAREDWGKIPVGAQKEIARREKHMDNMLRDSADSRKHQTDFSELIRPFEGMIAAQNSTPFQAVHNLMQTAAGLTMGSPQQKAQIIQNIMNQYGIDIEVLDQVLVGGMAKQPGQIGQQQVDPNIQYQIQQQMAPINQFMGQMNQQKQDYEAVQQQTLNTEIDTFAQDAKNEFFEDVRETMADLMDMSAKRNEAMSIQQAYDKACRMDEGINSIVTKREAASTAAERKAAIEKKRHAASSITGGNAANAGEPVANTLRGTLNDAWDDAS